MVSWVKAGGLLVGGEVGGGAGGDRRVPLVEALLSARAL